MPIRRRGPYSGLSCVFGPVGGGSTTCGKTSYFHWTCAIRSSSSSNSSGERVVQKRAILRAISRRAAAIASDFRRSSIEHDQRSSKIARSMQELSRRDRPNRLESKLALQTFFSRPLWIPTDHSLGSRSKRASLLVQRCIWRQAGHWIGSISSMGDASNV